MLWSRPWQFDKHIVHDGCANTYTLTKDGVKHMLNPLKEKEDKVCSVARIYFVDENKLLKGMKHEHISFVVFP